MKGEIKTGHEAEPVEEEKEQETEWVGEYGKKCQEERDGEVLEARGSRNARRRKTKKRKNQTTGSCRVSERQKEMKCEAEGEKCGWTEEETGKTGKTEDL